jgi:hypothetical protein
MAAADTDAETAPAPPPNLRASAQEDKECGNCVYFVGGAHCSKYPPLTVNDEWLCDGWKAGGKDTDNPPASSAHTVRQAQKGALANLRNARSRPQPQ